MSKTIRQNNRKAKHHPIVIKDTFEGISKREITYAVIIAGVVHNGSYSFPSQGILWRYYPRHTVLYTKHS